MSATKQKLVMIGNGMAGMRVIDKVLELAPDAFDIEIIGAEAVSSYNRIQLSPVLAGEKSFDDIVTHDDAWHTDNHIALHKGVAATEIDRDSQQVVLDNGVKLDYDKLVVATGSLPFIAPIPGANLENVIGFRDVNHVKKMTEYGSDSHVVVIGGGLLGLEAAYGLNKLGANVTVVHRSAVLMNRQMDAYSGNILCDQLNEKGLNIVCGGQTAELLSDDGVHVSAVVLDSGQKIPADLVVMAVGIRPNISLAKNSGLACDKGILVDGNMLTSDPNIYAVGECTEFQKLTFGLVAPLFEQAVSLAVHISSHGENNFEITPTATRLKVTGVELFSAGQFVEDDQSEVILFRDPAHGKYKKLVVKDNRIVGIILYGDTRDGSWYFDKMIANEDISSIRSTIIFGQIFNPMVEVA